MAGSGYVYGEMGKAACSSGQTASYVYALLYFYHSDGRSRDLIHDLIHNIGISPLLESARFKIFDFDNGCDYYIAW